MFISNVEYDIDMEKPEDSAVRSLVDPRLMDPTSELVARSHLSEDELQQSVAVLEAMSAWSTLERTLSEQSREYMKLGETDMRALRYLIAARRQGVIVMPRMIAGHLGITPAATTKLIDRLEAGGHVTRSPHPADRRSIALEVTEATSASARASVGRSHARRFDAIAGLTSADRAAVLRFYRALTASAIDIIE